MPKIADFLEEGFVERMNNLEGRIKDLEKSVCRCGLGPKKGSEKVVDGKGKIEDSIGKRDEMRKECDAEEMAKEETIGEETIRYAKLEL